MLVAINHLNKFFKELYIVLIQKYNFSESNMKIILLRTLVEKTIDLNQRK